MRRLESLWELGELGSWGCLSIEVQVGGVRISREGGRALQCKVGLSEASHLPIARCAQLHLGWSSRLSHSKRNTGTLLKGIQLRN
jgi:hypothetical protein